jgi:hypothetical protein
LIIRRRRRKAREKRREREGEGGLTRLSSHPHVPEGKHDALWHSEYTSERNPFRISLLDSFPQDSFPVGSHVSESDAGSGVITLQRGRVLTTSVPLEYTPEEIGEHSIDVFYLDIRICSFPVVVYPIGVVLLRDQVKDEIYCDSIFTAKAIFRNDKTHERYLLSLFSPK